MKLDESQAVAVHKKNSLNFLIFCYAFLFVFFYLVDQIAFNCYKIVLMD